MKKKYIGLSVILLASLLTMAAVYAATHHLVGKPVIAGEAPPAVKGPVYTPSEVAAFSDMISVCHKMDSLDNFYLRGTMYGKDPSDSSNLLNTEFVFCKRGKEFYYKLGDQEMIALRDVYIDIDRKLKKMEVSAPKDVVQPNLMKNETLLKMWQQESYTISRDTMGATVSIRLLCEQHATCKEYKMTYDASTRLMKDMYMRLTDINDPFNKEKDKIVRVTVTQWEMQPRQVLLDRLQYLDGHRGGWIPARHYADYTISHY